MGEGVDGWEVGEKVAPDPIIWCGECSACKKGHYPACINLRLIGIDCDGGFTQFISLPPSMLYKVPDNIPDEYVALIEVLSIGCHVKNRAEVKKEDTVVIWGVVNPVRGCIQSVSGEGKVCVLGLGNEASPVIFKESIWKEASIVSSRVSHGEFSEVIDSLSNERLKPDALISRILPGSQTQKGFELLEQNPEDNIKILLNFQDLKVISD